MLKLFILIGPEKNKNKSKTYQPLISLSAEDVLDFIQPST
jgi:hypothetical protein